MSRVRIEANASSSFDSEQPRTADERPRRGFAGATSWFTNVLQSSSTGARSASPSACRAASCSTHPIPGRNHGRAAVPGRPRHRAAAQEGRQEGARPCDAESVSRRGL